MAQGIEPTAAAYRARREFALSQATRPGIHKELGNRSRAQLLMLDLTAEQWQELIQSTVDRIAKIDELQASIMKREPEQLTQLMRETDALQQRLSQGARNADAQARLLASLAGIRLEMASVNAWVGPWSRAVIASTLLGVQEGYRTVLTESDTKVAKAAALAVGKKAVDFIPLLGPILTGSADAYEVANKREADLQTASDALSKMDEYSEALEHLSLTFEALLAVPDEMTTEALIERVTTRKARLLAAQT
jgi:hypothetical protein